MTHKERLKHLLGDMTLNLAASAETLCGLAGVARAEGDERWAARVSELAEVTWKLWHLVGEMRGSMKPDEPA